MAEPRTAVLLAVLASPAALAAQDRSRPWDAMDYGPCLAATVEGFTPDNVALKARVLSLGDDAGVVFDTELLRVACAWTGGRIELRGTAFDGAHGPIPRVRGAEVCSTPQGPGFAHEGSYADPRPIPHGPLPAAHGRFLGHYFHGDQVVLKYRVGGREVLELFEPARAADGATFGLYRNFEVGPGGALRTRLAEFDEPMQGEAELGGEAAVEFAQVTWRGRGAGAPPNQSLFLVVDGGAGARLSTDGGRVELEIPAAQEVQRVRVAFWTAPLGAGPGEVELDGRPVDLAALTRGGPRRYPQTLTTEGRLGDGEGPFVVDTITVPDANPWRSWLRFGAFDFVGDDTAALSTWNGDVWLVSGLDEDLDQLTWSRFCTGLFDPLGLKVVDGTIHVHGRDGLDRLRDLNGDGECDFVETFNNEVLVTRGFHEFAFDLQTDAAGNFYFSKGGPVNPGGRGFQQLVPHHGTVLRVGPDGSQLEVVATGVRAPNGIGVSPDGVVTSGDNQGTWMPACRLNTTRNGTFWGCTDLAHRPEPPATYDEPICWLPMAVDNSSGGQVFVPDGAFGPLGGMLLHQSYGQCRVYLVLQQEDEATGRVQGGVVALPAEFASSQMRGRFLGGALYTVGFKGWQTRAALDTAFQRVRRTAAPLRLPVGMRVAAGAIELTFSEPLDAASAADPESYEVEVWNYRWTSDYGSPEVRPSDPERRVRDGEQNRDTLRVVAARVGDDGRTVRLAVEGLQRVMQTRIAYSLDAADGGLVEGEIHGTIHFLPER